MFQNALGCPVGHHPGGSGRQRRAEAWRGRHGGAAAVAAHRRRGVRPARAAQGLVRDDLEPRARATLGAGLQEGQGR